jgi:hypothetical protein
MQTPPDIDAGAASLVALELTNVGDFSTKTISFRMVE